MKPSFNLLDERWVPVRFSTGEVREIGLLELFARAGDIIALAETSPPNLIALYRLLLAITHRALLRARGGWKDRDRAEWYRHSLPADAVPDYLVHWRERFWLFHPQHPFMQVAALAEAEETRDKTKSWAQIALDSANGNAPVVFDHSLDIAPSAIAPAHAVRNLLGFLQFTPGGLVKAVRGSDKSGALANTAAALPLGTTLHQTLCQALHPSDRASEHDRPAWEAAPPTIASLAADPCLASGPNDRYTRLSRAVLFLHDDRSPDIQLIRFAAGLALADDTNAPDPMASYRIGTNGSVRLSFTEGRATWRDLAALIPDASGNLAAPAACLAWAINLQTTLGIQDKEISVLVAGVASDQAKLLRWRSERFILPSALLLNLDAGRFLRQLIKEADSIYFRLRGIAAEMVAETMPNPAGKDTRSRARAALDVSPCAATYFSGAERALPRLMHLIAQGEIDAAERLWCETLATAAQDAWDTTFRSLGRSSAALRAEAITHPRFLRLLRELRGKTSPDTNQERNASSTLAEEVHS